MASTLINFQGMLKQENYDLAKAETAFVKLLNVNVMKNLILILLAVVTFVLASCQEDYYLPIPKLYSEKSPEGTGTSGDDAEEPIIQ